MKSILLLIMLTNLLFARYSLYYSKIKLGEIDTFETVQENYFKVKITNSLVKFFVKKDFFIYYNDSFNIETKNSNIKYKRDKYRIIEILNLAIFKDIKESKKLIISENKYIEVKKIKNNNYEFKYVKNNKIKTHGNFKIVNNELISFEEINNYILILKDD